VRFVAQNAPEGVWRRTRWESLQRSPDPLAGFRGRSRPGGGEYGKEGREGVKEEEGGKGNEG